MTTKFVQTKRRGVVFWAVALASAVLATPASATIVFERDDAIWTMNDDGSDQQVLITTAQVPGQERLSDPSVHPSGGPVLFNASNSTAFRVPSSGRTGNNTTGVYVYDRGAIRRLSSPQGPCTGPSAPHCSTYDNDPEPFGDGRYIASLFVIVSNSSGGSVQGRGSLFTENLDGTGFQDFPSRCDDGGRYPSSPSPNPVNGNEVAYTFCSDGNGDDELWIDRPGDANDTSLVDDSSFLDPSWQPDGSRVVWGEGGGDPGIWSYKPDGTDGRHTVVLPNSDILNSPSPRYVGNNQIVFAYDAANTDATSPDLYKIDAGCSACPLSQAQRLTTDGKSTTPAWTAASRADLLPAPTGGNGTGTGTGTGTDTGTGTGTGTEQDTVAPIAGVKLAGKRPKLAAALKKGLTINVSSTEPGSAIARATVSGKDAKGLKVAATKAAGSGKATLAGAGNKRLVVKFTKKAQKKFRRRKSLKLTLVVTVTDRAGNTASPRKMKVTLKR